MISDKEWFNKRHTIYDGDFINPVMDKKLVINVAPTGAFIKREQNPNQSYTPREVAKQVIESYKMGASVFHVHVRDEKGIIQQRNIPAILEAVDMVLDACPDMILSQSGHVDVSKRGVDSVSPLIEPLYEAGKKSGRNYLHTMVLLPQATNRMYMNEQDLKAIIEYIQSRGMRAEFQIDGYRALHNAVSWVIKSGETKKPYVMNLLSGTHGSSYVGPTLPDPWGQLYMMSMLASIKTLIPSDLVTGATIGGHNWLPLTVQAIMLGVDCVRIGMEDTLWMYPHKDEVISSCAEVVRKVATIAKELGRDIATPSEARQILGLS